MFFIVFYPLPVALVPTFVSGSFIFSFSVLLFGFIPVNLYIPLKLLFSCSVLFFGLLFPRIFACLCGPLLRFSASAI